MTDQDPFDLQRFVTAQATVMDAVERELRAGRKRSHWMWFVFPQVQGLGSSDMARIYAIGSLDEARAYLAHPVLGPRLVACTRWVAAHEGRSLANIFGSPDDAKFSSSMTLFSIATGSESTVFDDALKAFCGGEPDRRTLALLGVLPSRQP